MELALQQNEIMDIFYDDYVNLADDDGIVGNKTNTNLKVREITMNTTRHNVLCCFIGVPIIH